MKVKVILNGTETNPYLAMGLKQNPFPQIPKEEYGPFMRLLNFLAAEPIKDTDELKKKMKGCSEEFVQLCCQQFKKGEMVRFEIEFPG